jgi:hypothetical protein
LPEFRGVAGEIAGAHFVPPVHTRSYSKKHPIRTLRRT